MYESCANYFIQVRGIIGETLGFAATKLITAPPFLPGVNVTKIKNSTHITFSLEVLHRSKLCKEKYFDFGRYILVLLSNTDRNPSSIREMEKLELFINRKLNDSFSIIRKYKIENFSKRNKFELFIGGVTTLRSKKKPELLTFPRVYSETRRMLVIEVVTYKGTYGYFGKHFYLYDPDEKEEDFLIGLIFILVLMILGIASIFL